MTQYIYNVLLDSGEMIAPDALVRRVVSAGRAVKVPRKIIAERLGVTDMTMFRWVKALNLPSVEQIDKMLEMEREFATLKNRATGH